MRPLRPMSGPRVMISRCDPHLRAISEWTLLGCDNIQRRKSGIRKGFSRHDDDIGDDFDDAERAEIDEFVNHDLSPIQGYETSPEPDRAATGQPHRLTAFRIGCLAWGSLVWDPRTLPRAGAFRNDGPWLPIEFSRVALDGRVTLVIDSTARSIQTLWVPLAARSLEEAIAALGVREKIASEMRPRWVGRQRRQDLMRGLGDADPTVRRTIAAWLEDRALDAVVWSALPPGGPDGEAKCPHFDRLLSHLISLEGEARVRAEEYIRRTPRSIRTVYRQRFEEFLGWVPTDGED